jgi:hypothetical protein
MDIVDSPDASRREIVSASRALIAAEAQNRAANLAELKVDRPSIGSKIWLPEVDAKRAFPNRRFCDDLSCGNPLANGEPTSTC